MCPDYQIGLNETRLGIIPPIFLQASMRNTISKREAEKSLILGTLYTTDDALRVGFRLLLFNKPKIIKSKIISDWID